MKFINKIFLLTLVVPGALNAAGPLSGTSGGNLTSFGGNVGAMNNNSWNAAANTGKPLPTADFGNCNALIMRCAQPKCASGGCVDMNVATPIVAGCVNANESCKSYGDDLINYIAAQLVASSTAKASENAAAANESANSAAAAQSSEQLAAMQSQMSTLQEQITAQNEQTNATVADALAQQKALLEQQAATTKETPASSEVVQQAVSAGVSAEVLVRQQASGEIMTKLENATDSLKALKKIMQTAFDYAGCDASGNNCTGPKRIAVFKDKANDFFEPYENVLDETYDALITAQALGVDISDIYMLLNNSCNQWGKYLCEPCSAKSPDQDQCDSGYYNVKKDGSKVAGSQPHCTFMQLLTSRDDIQLNWLDMDAGSSGGVRVACASDVLDNSMLFKSRKKQTNIDIEVLQRIIEQDSPNYLNTKNNETANPALTKYCAITDTRNLEKIITLKTLPDKVCIKDIDSTKPISGSCTEYDFVNPEYALCTTAAYNIGADTNPSDPADQEQMKQVVALKSTIIAQQMKKQYDYLETTVKRLKTQLEKSVLTTNMQVAGASSESGSGSSKSSDKNVILSDAENCKLKTSTTSTMECLQNNIRAIRYAISNGNTTQAKRQLQSDLDIANLYSIKDMKNCENISSLSVKNDLTKCVDDFSIKVMQSLESKQEKQQSQKSMN